MNKTVAEAAEFLDALLPRIAATQHDVVICPPFTALTAVVERRHGTAVRVAAQNMHEEESGAFTGEVSAPMLVELDVEAVILGHSERRQLFGETDEALAQKVPAALAAGLEPILCVGETEEARDGGQTEEVLERQLQADLAEVEAGEPRRGRDRLRADLGDRHRPHRHPRAGPGGVRLHPRRAARRAAPPPTRCGSSTAARSSPATPPSCSPSPTSTAPWSAAPASTRRTSRRSSRRRAEVPRPGPLARAGHPRRLGAGPARPRQRDLAGRDAGLRRLWARYPHTQLSAQGPDVGLPDGQMGNSEVGHLNLGAGAIVKQDLARIDDAIADGSFFENEALLAACERAREARAGACTCSAWSPTAASTPAGSTSRRRSSWPRRRASPTSSSTPSPTAATRCRTAAASTSPSWSAGCARPGRVGTVSGRYYAMDRDTRWERIKLAYDAIVHARGPAGGERRRGDRGLLRARGDRRVRQADRDRRLRRRRRRRRRRSSSTSAPTGRAR